MHLGRIIILALIVLLILPSLHTNAAPGTPSSAKITGEIQDMWLSNDRCYFRIKILNATDSWINYSDHSHLLFNSSWWEEKTVDAYVKYFNQSSLKNVSIPSSQGWRIGDIVSGTIWHQNDERSEWYWLNTTSKSNINYAEPLLLFIKPSTLLIVIAIGCSIAIVTGFVYYRSRRHHFEKKP